MCLDLKNWLRQQWPIRKKIIATRTMIHNPVNKHKQCSFYNPFYMSIVDVLPSMMANNWYTLNGNRLLLVMIQKEQQLSFQDLLDKFAVKCEAYKFLGKTYHTITKSLNYGIMIPMLKVANYSLFTLTSLYVMISVLLRHGLRLSWLTLHVLYHNVPLPLSME